GPAIGSGRGAVVEDAAVVRPGEAPFGLDGVVGEPALARPVAARLGKDAGVDPAAGRRRAVVLQLGEAGRQAGPAGAGVDLVQMTPVDLLEHLLEVRFALDPADRSVRQTRTFVKVVVPGET